MQKYPHACLFVGNDPAAVRVHVDAIVRELMPTGYELDLMRVSPERDPETGKVRDIPIEMTRQLKSWISLKPTGVYKIAIIDDADRLGGEAANNILKVLEEPPAYAHFFLMTTRPGQILPTVASRCQRIAVSPASVAVTSSAAVKALGAALKADIPAKIAYAKKLADDPDAVQIVTQALTAIHGTLATRPDLAPVARGLLTLLEVLEQPQFNRRLAVEDFLLTLQK